MLKSCMEKKLFVFYVPRGTNINFLLTLSIGYQEEGYEN